MSEREATKSYKGFEIEAHPHRLPHLLGHPERWDLNIVISRRTGDAVHSKPFSSQATCATEEDAIRACVDFGKRIIDGRVPECTVNDL